MVNDVTFFQFTGHILHRDAGADHQHQNMVGKIADLVNGLFLILFFARNDDLGALLAHLFEDLFLALLEEVGGVAALLGAGLAALDEVIIAGEKEDKAETVYEISDLAYHVLVLMVQAGITVEDVTRELEKRHVIDHKVKQERMQ